MSNASPQVVEYLVRQLARNPITHSGEIVATRARAFKLTAAKADIPEASNRAPADRRHARVQLETIRGQCFAAPVGQLVSQLDELHLDDFPDLEALASRLRTILNCRGRLPALAGHKDFDGDFFACLKKVLTSPSREVSVLREQVLSSFRVRRNRRRGQAMVRLLKEELPELYALEADWLGSLVSSRGSKFYGPTVQRTASAAAESATGGRWWIALAVIVLLKAAIWVHWGSSSQTPDRSPSPFVGADDRGVPQNLRSPTTVIPRESSYRSGEYAANIEKRQAELRARAEEARRDWEKFRKEADLAHQQRLERINRRLNRSTNDGRADASRGPTKPSTDQPSEAPDEHSAGGLSDWGRFEYRYGDEGWSLRWGDEEVLRGTSGDSGSVLETESSPPARFE